MRRIRRIGLALLGVGAGAYCLAVGYLFVFQRDFVFVPRGELTAEDAREAGFEPVTIGAEDGTRLAGWYRPADEGRPTLLYFHGNTGNLGGRADRFRQVAASGFGLLAMSYRGYPGSQGSPSERAFSADALTAFDWLAARASPIVVYGESLGTAVATSVASRRDAEALVLEAPFTAIVDIAAETYPWVPVGLLMRDQFRSRDLIGKIGMPVLILQGTDDAVVPTEQGRRLYDLAPEPKEFVVIEGGHHGDLWDRGLWPRVVDFLARLPAGAPYDTPG